MTTIGTAPHWNRNAPSGAWRDVIRAAEAASRLGGDRAAAIMRQSPQDPRWLAIASVRALAGLLAGPDAREKFDQMRSETLQLAEANGADDLLVTLYLEVIACAEAYERGALLRVDEITRNSQFLPSDCASAAAQFAGQLVACMAGDDAPRVFAALKHRHGIEDGAQ
jgi:hypothetical protein